MLRRRRPRTCASKCALWSIWARLSLPLAAALLLADLYHFFYFSTYSKNDPRSSPSSSRGSRTWTARQRGTPTWCSPTQTRTEVSPPASTRSSGTLVTQTSTPTELIFKEGDNKKMVMDILPVLSSSDLKVRREILGLVMSRNIEETHAGKHI